MTRPLFRQGDVLIIAADNLPADGLALIDRDAGRVVLAYGEVTGHAHAIAEPDVELYAHDAGLGDRFLRVLAEGGADVVHEEHGTIHLDPGDYRVRIQREYTPAAIVRVAD